VTAVQFTKCRISRSYRSAQVFIHVDVMQA
jgi:hypothetical protein